MRDTSATVAKVSPLIAVGKQLAVDHLPEVAWELVPNFPMVGRTSWIPLTEPIPTPDLSVPSIHALKLKGVGLALRTGHVLPPQTIAVEGRGEHIGISEDGQLRFVVPEPAPLGGIYLDRALAEFDNAGVLAVRRCPTVVPVALYRYVALRCEAAPDRPLGAVLLGSPNAAPARTSVLFVRQAQDPAAADGARSELVGDLGAGQPLRAISAMAFEAGRTLRAFHEAGLYRYNGNPTNYLYCPANRRICLIDLDSSRPLRECSTTRRPLELVRDAASAIFQMARALKHPSPVWVFSAADLRSGLGPLASFASGYFAECDPLLCRDALSGFEKAAFPDSWIGGRDADDLSALTGARKELIPSLMAALLGPYRQTPLHDRYPLQRRWER